MLKETEGEFGSSTSDEQKAYSNITSFWKI